MLDSRPLRLKGHILPIGGEPIRQELPRATETCFDKSARHTLGGESSKLACTF